jgi:hypothetical protein
MFGFCLRAVGIAIVLAVMVNIVMITIGKLETVNPAVSGFISGCQTTDVLCWYGVIYREANPRMAQETLVNAGYSLVGQNNDFIQGRAYENYLRAAGNGCNRLNLVYTTQTERPQLLFLNLEDCRGIYVGDLFDLFGAPQYIITMPNIGFLFFENNIQAAFGGRLRLYAPVLNVRVNDSPVSARAFAWQGFATYWYYCQMETPVDFCQL